MVTLNLLKECWERIVLAHKEGLTFTSEWSAVLDSAPDKHLPNVKWMKPRVAITNSGGIMRKLFTCVLFFEDDHESDRENETRDDVYERMQVVAELCFLMFIAAFIDDETRHEGVLMNAEQEGAATFDPSFDSAGRQITGCMMTVTIADTTQICPDPYFNAI